MPRVRHRPRLADQAVWPEGLWCDLGTPASRQVRQVRGHDFCGLVLEQAGIARRKLFIKDQTGFERRGVEALDAIVDGGMNLDAPL